MSEETREFLEAYKARRDLEEIIKRKDDEMKQKDDDLNDWGLTVRPAKGASHSGQGTPTR